VRAFPFFPRWRSLLDSLETLTDEARARLEEEYVDLFLLGELHSACPLYESAYLDRTGRSRGVIAAGVEQAYAAAGVAVSPAAQGELPDHVAFELEFLSLLCAEEARAWRAGLPDEASDRMGRERDFLERHLLRFLPGLVRAVKLVSTSSSFYRRLAEAVHAFVVHDRDLIGALAEAYASAPKAASEA